MIPNAVRAESSALRTLPENIHAPRGESWRPGHLHQNLCWMHYPNLFLSSRVASATGEEVRHIRYRGFDQKYYKDIILELVREHGPISREKIDNLLMDKLPEVLMEKQKKTKIHNLLYILSGHEKKIENMGSRKYPLWAMKSNKKQ